MGTASSRTGIEEKFVPAKNPTGSRKRAVAPLAELWPTRLEVFDRGRGRACIVGVRKNSAAVGALEAWLAGRIDVVGFEFRAGSGEFRVRYDDGAALPGRFIRSLRDKVHTLNRIRPERFNARPVHSLRGRVRIHVTGIGDRELSTLTMLAGGLPGVKSTTHYRGGRSMLVVYDPRKVSQKFILTALLKSEPAEWARDWHEPTPIRWGAALSGTSTLIACITGALPFPLLAIFVAMNTVRPLSRSIAALREGQVSIDLLDVAATLAALATGRPITAAFVIWDGVGQLSFRRCLGTSLISEVVIGMGASIGREAAPKLLGCASASALASWA